MIEFVFAYFLAASPAPEPPKSEKVAIEHLVCLPVKEEELVTPPSMRVRTKKKKMFAKTRPERLANVARKAHRVLRNGPSSKKQEQIPPVSQTKTSRTGKFTRKKKFS